MSASKFDRVEADIVCQNLSTHLKDNFSNLRDAIANCTHEERKLFIKVVAQAQENRLKNSN